MKKMNKQEMINQLKGLVGKVTDKSTLDIVNYTLKMFTENPRNVEVKDLKETLADVISKVVPQQQTVLPMENSSKKLTVKKNKEKTPDVKKDNKEDKTPAKENKGSDKPKITLHDPLGRDKKDDKDKKVDLKTDKSDKKDTKNTKTNKTEPKKELVKAVPMAISFPDEFDVKNLGHLKKAEDIKDIKTLAEIIQKGERDIVVVTYWSKRLLKQFEYDNLGIQKTPVKEFPDDLDVLNIMYASPEGTVAYGVSVYTECQFAFTPEDFANEEDGVRFSAGMEFNLYEVVPEK